MDSEIPVTRRLPAPAAECGPAEERLRRAVLDRVFPGAAAAAGGSEGARWISGVGRLDYTGGAAAGPSTLYDLASLTKVIATTSVVMRLFEEGRMALEAPVADFIPEFRGGGREVVRIEHLLTHSSGLPAWRALYREASGPKEALALVASTPLESPPGMAERYSDLGAILLGECAARAGGLPLATLSWKLVFDPLAMRDTLFCPPLDQRSRIAPTEEDHDLRGRLIHGEVHDENCWALGGVSGHAGLFSTAEDLARFAVELLRSLRGAPGARLFRKETLERFTARRSLVSGSSRALGWDTRSDAEDTTGPAGSRSSSGRRFGPGSFGHTGFTGTSIWFDPARDLFAVLLSNRVHPTRANDRMQAVRRDFHDLVVEGLGAGQAQSRLERAVRDLSDAWFVLEEAGRPLGYHHLVVRLTPEGEVAASDEIWMAPGAGGISFRSEVTTGPDLLSPRRARCETRQGVGKGETALRGSVEFTPDGLRLSAVVLVNPLGFPLSSPEEHQGTEKRPPGTILFQSLVPLLLSSLGEGEDGSRLGELVLAELPVTLDRLIALKPGRRLRISSQGGARRVAVLAGGEETSSATLRFGPGGELERIEREQWTERRAPLDEVRRLLPGGF
jgi:CubicO group peptidase (beta-lactamase class C family)